jgi:hypothetical protein
MVKAKTEMVTDMGYLEMYLGSGFVYVTFLDVKGRNYRRALA